jgi:hypothetical protein
MKKYKIKCLNCEETYIRNEKEGIECPECREHLSIDVHEIFDFAKYTDESLLKGVDKLFKNVEKNKFYKLRKQNITGTIIYDSNEKQIVINSDDWINQKVWCINKNNDIAYGEQIHHQISELIRFIKEFVQYKGGA